jgi:hypothetical protein
MDRYYRAGAWSVFSQRHGPARHHRDQVCRQWWNHESVMMRMTALWQGYEVAYAEGGGAMSTWMLDHADRHFDRIMAEGGPLTECRSDHGSQMVRYPTDPLPEGLNLDAATVPPAQPGTDWQHSTQRPALNADAWLSTPGGV